MLMRYDDMLATVLAQAADRPDRQAARWRQLVDLLAQGRPDAAAGHSEAAAYTWLRGTRAAIDPQVRRESAQSLAGREISPTLIAFFAEDMPAVAAPLIAGARLDLEAWLALLPRLGPAARSLLRNREDLLPEVKAALQAFGPSDFRIEGAVASGAAAAPDEAARDPQLRQLGARDWRSRPCRPGPRPGPPAP